LWVEAYYRFTEAEREQVISFIFREGAKSLIERLEMD
ncbi:DNA-binding protein, partial [Yersinia pestis subsp. pestis]|nr:DNA-binding protein [Yersinia pestis subsp. pestis]